MCMFNNAHLSSEIQKTAHYLIGAGQAARDLHIALEGTEDGIRLQASRDCTVQYCVIDDAALAVIQQQPHRDAIQLIPEDNSLGWRSQFAGARLINAGVHHCRIDGGLGMLQGVFAGDGLLEQVLITNNVIDTHSMHQISLSGLLSGWISNNRESSGQLVPVLLRPARFCGGENIWVLNFANGATYAPVGEIIDPQDGFDHVDDQRQQPQSGINLVDFDLVGFQSAVRLLPVYSSAQEYCRALAHLILQFGKVLNSNHQGSIMDFAALRRQIILKVINDEGRYVNHPADRGKATNFGITAATASRHGKRPENISLEEAIEIYESDFWSVIQGDQLLSFSAQLAHELFDIAVHMGPGRAGDLLQRALNVMNSNGTHYSDVKLDGVIGGETLGALRGFLAKRGGEGIDVLLKALVSMRGAAFVNISEHNPSQEAFTYGWVANRVHYQVPEDWSRVSQPPISVEHSIKPAVPVQTEPFSKPWIKSKLIHLGVSWAVTGIVSLIALFGYDADTETVAAISASMQALGGVAVVIIRKYFTKTVLN